MINNSTEGQILLARNTSTRSYKHFCFGNLAYVFFLLGTVFTVVGPVIHYSCYGLSLILMLLSQFFEKSAIFKKPTGSAKTIFIWFFVFFLFVSFPNAINATSFYVWGKGASVFLEAILYTYMAFCLFDTDEKREKLVTWFVWANVIFAIEICLRPLYPMWFTGLPLKILDFNTALHDGACNESGEYATLIFPALLIYAKFFCNNVLVAALLICVALLMTICSFSVGYYGAAAVCILSFTLLLILKKQLRLKNLLFALVIAIIIFSGLFAIAPTMHREFLQREFAQASALFTGDTSSNIGVVGGTEMAQFTTDRDGVWKIAIDMIRTKPFVGWGYGDFERKSKEFFENKKELLHFDHYGYYDKDGAYDHPHNIYLAVAVAGGIPALLSFLIFALYLAFATIRAYFKGQSKQTVIFALLTLMALATQASVGLTGDLFCARRDIAVIFWAFLGVFLATLQTDSCDVQINTKNSKLYIFNHR